MMTAMSYNLNFEGYWRDQNSGGLPAASGIYCVYAGTYAAMAGTVSLRKLLYVGESEDVRARVAAHERRPDWKRGLIAGEELIFSAALISPTGARQRAEAAVIHHHRPPTNTEYRDAFPFDETIVQTGGRNVLLDAYFVVRTTATYAAFGRGW